MSWYFCTLSLLHWRSFKWHKWSTMCISWGSDIRNIRWFYIKIWSPISHKRCLILRWMFSFWLKFESLLYVCHNSIKSNLFVSLIFLVWDSSFNNLVWVFNLRSHFANWASQLMILQSPILCFLSKLVKSFISFYQESKILLFWILIFLCF